MSASPPSPSPPFGSDTDTDTDMNDAHVTVPSSTSTSTPSSTRSRQLVPISSGSSLEELRDAVFELHDIMFKVWDYLPFLSLLPLASTNKSWAHRLSIPSLDESLIVSQQYQSSMRKDMDTDMTSTSTSTSITTTTTTTTTTTVTPTSSMTVTVTAINPTNINMNATHGTDMMISPASRPISSSSSSIPSTSLAGSSSSITTPSASILASLSIMMKGVTFRAYPAIPSLSHEPQQSSHATATLITCWYDEESKAIRWMVGMGPARPIHPQRIMPIRNIVGYQLGKNVPELSACPGLAAHCFSIMCRTDPYTLISLHLQASSESQRNVWLAGLRHLCLHLSEADPECFPLIGSNTFNISGPRYYHERAMIDLTAMPPTPLNIPFFAALFSLTHFRIAPSLYQQVNIHLFRMLPHMPNLKYLDLTGCTMVNDQCAQIIGTIAPALYSLVLARARDMSNIGIRSLRTCRSLRFLDLSLCPQIGDEALYSIGKYFPRLRELMVTRSQVPPAYPITDQGVIRAIQRNKKIRLLNLSFATTLHGRCIPIIASTCHHLQTLCLNRCAAITMHPHDVPNIFSGFSQLKYLKSLDLRHVRELNDTALHGISACRELRNLKLSACPLLTDIGMRRIATSCRWLRRLRLGNCIGLTDATLQELSTSCRQLEDLSVRGCERITDAGVCELGTGLHRLRSLKLRECILITDVGVMSVLRGCQLLDKLDISSCHLVTDTSLLSIPHTAAHLKILVFNNSRLITRDAVQLLRSRRPTMYIAMNAFANLEHPPPIPQPK